jgi:mannitol/fructose-specific phosphotransferase system IIA component (Ntr-type)
VLLLPTTADSDQLDALSSIARRLRAPEILVQLRGAKNAGELYSAIVG